MIKAPKSSEIEEINLTVIKIIYDKPIAYTKWRRTEIISTKMNNETRISSFSPLFDIVLIG